MLLAEGIGDTIRVSLTPEPGGDRTQEVIVAQEILQTMGLRSFLPMVVACPGCGRTTSTYFQELAQRIQSHIRHRMPQWRSERVGVEEMTVAVMGCVVNGPGESRHASIGISLPGTGERPVAPVYEDGEKTVTLKGDRIAEEFQELMERYIERTYPRRMPRRRHHDRTADRRCVPCEGGVAPLSRAAAEEVLQRLDENWQLALDATSIQREFRFKDFFRTMSFVNARGACRQHRGPPSGPGSRLRLLPRAIHHARDRRAVGKRLHLRGEDRPAAARLTRTRPCRRARRWHALLTSAIPSRAAHGNCPRCR